MKWWYFGWNKNTCLKLTSPVSFSLKCVNRKLKIIHVAHPVFVLRQPWYRSQSSWQNRARDSSDEGARSQIRYAGTRHFLLVSPSLGIVLLGSFELVLICVSREDPETHWISENICH